jgi:formate dehydrogenase subunit gamma
MARRETLEDRIKGDSIVRFRVHQIIQHILMFSSFAVLAVTGFPMKYRDTGGSKWFMGLFGGAETVSTVHHVAAWFMVAACVYHLGYLLLTTLVLRRPFPTSMFPRFKDVKDFVQDMKHTFGLTEHAPRFDRFSYRNKGAYWLVFFGALITVSSGLLLMYPGWTASHFAGWMSPLALVMHSDAAILAVGWMLIVHLYFAHLSKHVFPMDKAIFTGKVSIARYKNEFPLEYERIMATAEAKTAEAGPTPAPASPERVDVTRRESPASQPET